MSQPRRTITEEEDICRLLVLRRPRCAKTWLVLAMARTQKGRPVNHVFFAPHRPMRRVWTFRQSEVRQKREFEESLPWRN